MPLINSAWRPLFMKIKSNKLRGLVTTSQTIRKCDITNYA